MKCDIILPVCDQYKFTKPCIESIFKNTFFPYRLIVINNGPSPEMRAFLDNLKAPESAEITIIHNSRNMGWVDSINMGIRISRAPFVCFQNDDTLVTAGWLGKMVDILNKNGMFGLINPTWEGKPDRLSVDEYNGRLESINRGSYTETDWCRGFCVVIKRDVIDKIGEIDNIYSPAYFDDVDYSVSAINAGFLCLRALDTYVHHYRNVTAFEVMKGNEWSRLHEKKKLTYYKKWGKPLNIAMILSSQVCKDTEKLDKAEGLVFYLARRQHHIYIFSPKRSAGRFRHTNVKVRHYHPVFFNLLSEINVWLNRGKRKEKKYNFVFKSLEPENIEHIKNTVDLAKERTKGSINVPL